ncbi:unnamed protein product [Caenorhabditis nigoni]
MDNSNVPSNMTNTVETENPITSVTMEVQPPSLKRQLSTIIYPPVPNMPSPVISSDDDTSEMNMAPPPPKKTPVLAADPRPLDLQSSGSLTLNVDASLEEEPVQEDIVVADSNKLASHSIAQGADDSNLAPLQRLTDAWNDFNVIFDAAMLRQPMADTNKKLDENFKICSQIKEVMTGFQGDQQAYIQWLQDMDAHFQKLSKSITKKHNDFNTAVEEWTKSAESKITEIKNIVTPLMKALEPLQHVTTFLQRVESVAGSLHVPVSGHLAEDVALGTYNHKPKKTTGKKCVLCNGGNHRTSVCRTYSTYTQRKERAKELRICLKCVRIVDFDSSGNHHNCPKESWKCTNCSPQGMDPSMTIHSPVFCMLARAQKNKNSSKNDKNQKEKKKADATPATPAPSSK